MAFCKDCNQEITWAETKNGKNIALETVASKDVSANGYSQLWHKSLRVHTVVKGKDALACPDDLKLHRPLTSAIGMSARKGADHARTELSQVW